MCVLSIRLNRTMLNGVALSYELVAFICRLRVYVLFYFILFIIFELKTFSMQKALKPALLANNTAMRH